MYGGKRPMRTLRLGMAQINPTVGDLEGNTRKIIQYINDAKEMGVDLLTFPELSIPGYPPEDLLLMPHFIDANLDSLQEVITRPQNPSRYWWALWIERMTSITRLP